MSNYNANSHLNLAKFAFNIYGALNNLSQENSPPSSSSSTRSHHGHLKANKRPNGIVYNCEKEVNCLTDLELQPNNGFNNNVVIGGKNYLKLLILSNDQSSILNEANILEPANKTSRLPGNNKLNNFNTIKSYKNTIAGGMVNGTVSLYQVLNNGKSRIIKNFSDHKRCVNSLDFLDVASDSTAGSSSSLLISGSQDGSIKLWDLRQAHNRPAVNILPKSSYDSVRSCQFSNHSTVRNKMVILSINDSGTLYKYDLRSVNQLSQGQPTPERKWNFHTGPGLSLSIHPEKEYVVTCGRDQKICVWNYGEDNHSYGNNAPDYVLNAYGPVMKVRWSLYANKQGFADPQDDLDYDIEPQNPLFNYDFACLYLNEDPTITVYNLRRKYVPTEVINSYSNKPYQNFIWAKNPEGKRRLWTLTKSNQFASRCLDSPSDFENITRPSDNLNAVSMAWGTNVGDLSFISQNETDFQTNYTYDRANDSSFESAIEADIEVSDASDYNKVVIGSGSHSNSSLQAVSLATSPIEVPRPQLMRSSTLANGKLLGHSPQVRTSMSFHNDLPLLLSKRPSLNRELSQNTIDSTMSVGSPINKVDMNSDPRKAISINHASPYVIPLSLPLLLNDDMVFETLSNNYLLTIPDGFSLVDVCLLNASVAASVNRFRDCQIWRILAVGLGQHVDGIFEDNDDNDVNATGIDIRGGGQGGAETENQDAKSILSEYGNFVGSYNSNSTLTTNYGGSQNTELASDKKSANPQSWGDQKSSSTNNLMDLINLQMNNSLGNLARVSSLSPSASRSNSMIAHVNSLRLSAAKADDNENAVEDDDEEESKTNTEEAKEPAKSMDDTEPKPIIKQSSAPVLGRDDKEEISRKTLKLGTSPQTLVFLNRVRNKRDSFLGNTPVTTSRNFDLDNENLNILNNIATNSSFSSSNVSGGHVDHRSSIGSTPSNYMGSFKSRRSSSIAPTYGFMNSKAFGNGLEEVDETSSNSSSRQDGQESGLTKAIENEKKNNDSLEIPWTISKLLEKSLDHACLRGDVMLCSSLALLFYPFTKALKLTFIEKNKCLEWISLYIEILQKRNLFVNAANVIKVAPKDIQEHLLAYYNGDNLKFYCQFCNQLIVNEDAKIKAKNGEIKDFGYWYCENCKRSQLNCVYCNEPCMGLNVVTSLKCGHRGHFGCLREWFIEEENFECPGGCEEVLF